MVFKLGHFLITIWLRSVLVVCWNHKKILMCFKLFLKGHCIHVRTSNWKRNCGSANEKYWESLLQKSPKQEYKFEKKLLKNRSFPPSSFHSFGNVELSVDKHFEAEFLSHENDKPFRSENLLRPFLRRNFSTHTQKKENIWRYKNEPKFYDYF